MSDHSTPESLYENITPAEFPGSWQGSKQLQPSRPFDFTTPNRPALGGWFHNKMWCVYRGGYGTNKLCYISRGQSDSWSSEAEIPGQTTLHAPALAVFDTMNRLYCVYIGSSGDNKLYCTYWDGNSWSSGKAFPKHYSTWGPALAAYDDKLWCVHTGNGRDQGLYYTTSSDGENWSDDKSISGRTTAGAPALAASDNQLLCVHRGGTGDEVLYYTSWDGSRWDEGGAISLGERYSAYSSDGPGLAYASAAEIFALVFKGGGSDTQLYYTVGTPSTNAWHQSVKITGSKSQAGPALLAFPYAEKTGFSCMYRGVNNT